MREYFEDFFYSIKKIDLWVYLSYTDIRQKYRRSYLGPIWLTLSTMIFIGMISLVWSTIFKQSLNDYLPFFSIGYVVWLFISTQLSDACTGFIQFEYLIKQMKLPYPVFILRILARNIIIFFHNLIVVILIIPIVGNGFNIFSIISIFGFFILAIFLFFLSVLIALITTRFRDFQMIVQNSIPIIFYISPIMWEPKLISEKYIWIITYNPIVPFLEIIRKPLLGTLPEMYVWGQAILITLIFGAITLIFFNKYKNKISYWI